MKFFLLPVAFMAAGAVAQATSACAADYVVESCLGSERSKLAACASTDYECLCAGNQSLITCFNNCPNDVRVKNAQGQRDIFCGYASQFPSKATNPATPSQTSGATNAQQTSDKTQGDSSSRSGSASGSPSSTSSSSPATNSNSAAYLALNAGGVLAAIAGVVAVVL
ncbi:hypothetical protein QBC43DRAFT_47208 [Cladorrhinum sp. PSN259]|nr:hypothetical protein QBC43DRAFT_47208 [Cladorrhinum sp. PSN259]